MTPFSRRPVVTNGIIFLFYVGLVLFHHRHVLPLPYHWDEVLVYYYPVHHLLHQGIWESLALPWLFFFHPPGMQLLALPFYWVLGDIPLAGRLFSALTAALCLFFTYKLGEQYRGKLFGFLCSLLVLYSRSFFPHLTQFHADLTLAGLAAAYLYFGIKGNFWPAFIFGLLAGAVRETALAFGLAIFAYRFFVRPFPFRLPSLKTSLVVLSPALSLGTAFIAFGLIMGNFFNHEAITKGDIRFHEVDFLVNLQKVFSGLASGWASQLNVFGFQGQPFLIALHGILVLLFACVLVWKKVSLKCLRLEMAFFVALATFVAFFSFNSGFLPRYLLPVFPLYILLFMGQIWRVSKVAVFAVCIVALLTAPRRYYIAHEIVDPKLLAYEYTMDFADMIRMHQAFGRIVEQEVPIDAKILSGWPMINIMLDPAFGYVSNKRIDASNLPHEEIDFLIDASCLPKNESARLKPRFEDFEEVKRLERPGMWIALYRRIR